MTWLKSYCRFLFLRPWNELKCSKWYMVLIALPLISTVLTFVQLFVIIQVPLPAWSTQTWLILFLLSVVVTLLLLVEGLRRYDARMTAEIREEWDRRSKILRVLSEDVARGELLYRRCESPTYEGDVRLVDDITRWHGIAASHLEHETGLGEAYRDRFYKRSDTGEKTPLLNECLAWMHNRLYYLKGIREEFERPPEALAREAGDESAPAFDFD